MDLTPDSLLEYIKNAGKPLTKRDLARAFGLKDHEKIPLKKMLKSMCAEGSIEQTPGKTFILAGGGANAGKDGETPAITTLLIVEVSIDGEVYGEPEDDDANLPLRVFVEPGDHKHNAPGEGDRVLAQIKERKNGEIVARVLKKLGAGRDRMVLGRAAKAGPKWILQPVNRKEREDYQLNVPADMQAQLEHGALVEAIADEVKSLRKPQAKLHAIIGHDDDPKAISLIALHEQGLRTTFPQAVVDETDGMTVPPLGNREDLRKIPLVTIDGEDARDFDDAVFAERDGDDWHLIVAIADVSHYVRTGAALDKEAFKRGNSTYFPDRVLPMLPEKLSNDMCSLRPKEDRACLAVHMTVDDHGNLKKYKFVRGLMKSVARLTYEQVQKAIDGETDATTEMLVDDVIKPLYAAFKILDAARIRRGALDLDMKERKVVVDAKGNMTGVMLRPRYDSHKLIEEFMILANVAAAMALEAKSAPCIYRIHDVPSAQKLDSARAFLSGFGINLAKGQVVKPELFNNILRNVKDKEFAPLVSQIVLRSQSQAVYSPDNIGHFGLSLQKYAHFTSPIRRYADLIVHRSLIRAWNLGDGGLEKEEVNRLHEIAEHISQTERTSMEAERASVDRFTAAFLSQRMGQVFEGRISGVTRFGLFVTLTDTGADGLVPIRSLPQDFYIHSEEQHALIGRRSGRLFRLCAPVRIRVIEADRLTGSSVFELVDADGGADVPGYMSRRTHVPDIPRKGGQFRGKKPHKPGPGGGHKRRGRGKGNNRNKKPGRGDWD